MSFGNYIEVGLMDEIARRDSPVHRLDARTKVLTTAAFILTVMSFPRYELSALMPFLLYPLVLITAGGIPAGYVMRKVLIAAPFALVVGMFNPLLDREIMVAFGSFGISGGWVSFASIIVRFVLTVSAGLTLVACTGIHRLGAGLVRLGVPRVFVVQLQLLYRYLFVITDDAIRMGRAVEMRSTGRSAVRPGAYISMTGHLLIRSIDRAQRVYQAMVLRGYDGSIRVVRPTAVGPGDVIFLCAWIMYFAVARTWNVSEWLGNVVMGIWS